MTDSFTIRFLQTGIQTTLQDAGRSGYQSLGIPASGVMDRKSAAIANQLIGRPRHAALLELTMLGPQLEFSGGCQIAICGADLSPTWNGQPVPQWETVTLPGPGRLGFGTRRSGCRAYLAIRIQWLVRRWLGSSSASGASPETWTPDSVFQSGETRTGLRLPDAPRLIYPDALRPVWSDELEVGLRPGPEWDWFSRIEQNSLTSQSFVVSPQSNRMGYRLAESLQGFTPKPELISSGVVPGTIQVPASGSPILLMRDAQTTGGYPRIGNVIEADLDSLAQLPPGSRIRFRCADQSATS